jgi:hypothetical protein
VWVWKKWDLKRKEEKKIVITIPKSKKSFGYTNQIEVSLMFKAANKNKEPCTQSSYYLYPPYTNIYILLYINFLLR